jgi:uncharacterized protein with HEPN domain
MLHCLIFIGMRDTVAHKYDRIDFGILWSVVMRSVLELLEMITPLLPSSSEEG